MNLVAALEGVLYLCGDEGIGVTEASQVLGVDETQLLNLAQLLSNELNEANRGLKLEKFGQKYKLVTKSEYHSIFEKLIEVDCQKPLTITALEVLAIVAYNEPVTRIIVDEIRGINSSHMIRTLKNRELIAEVGRSDSPGRPILYKTTTKFLDMLGLNSIDELPVINFNLEETKKEENLFNVKYTEKTSEIK